VRGRETAGTPVGVDTRPGPSAKRYRGCGLKASTAISLNVSDLPIQDESERRW
jgi:hypothetical protein